MSKRIDITGKRFGRLLVIGYEPHHKGSTAWRCVCTCGKEKLVSGNALRSGRTKSCGCLSTEVKRERGKEAVKRMHKVNVKHGGKHERLYRVWRNMKDRCYNVHSDAYKDYGARGITICDEWLDYAVFREWALAHGYDEKAAYKKCTIDRIDVNKGYAPWNCRWVDAKTQNLNTRRNVWIEFNGEKKTLSQWADEYGIDRCAFRQRVLVLGWDTERALTTPVKSRK